MSYNPDETRFLKKLGQRIRLLREEKRVSQEAFSFICGLHRTYISSIERGERNIAVINLRKIADALGVSMTQLLGDVDTLKEDES